MLSYFSGTDFFEHGTCIPYCLLISTFYFLSKLCLRSFCCNVVLNSLYIFDIAFDRKRSTTFQISPSPHCFAVFAT